MKKIYGLIGHPVKHSLSAVMQNAAFKSLGMDAEYILFDKTAEELNNFLIKIRRPESDVYGVNVTIPHKVIMRDLLKDNLNENAKVIGAVNTIIVEEEGNLKKLTGDNTDGEGFLQSLNKDLKFDPKDKITFVLGAGGAARAVIMSLGNLPEKIYFYDIDERKTEALEAIYKRHFDAGRIHKVSKKDIANCALVSDLFVNATNVGMKDTDDFPIDPGCLHKNMFIFDLIYNPRETKLLKLAKEKNLACVNGLGMLLYQGIASFKLWTKETPPIDVMREAINQAAAQL